MSPRSPRMAVLLGLTAAALAAGAYAALYQTQFAAAVA